MGGLRTYALLESLDCQKSGALSISAAELHGFKPANCFSLTRDYFSLPHKSDSHDAHGEDANSDDETLLCFGSRDTEAASDPSHSNRSPSTRPLRCGPTRELPADASVASH